MSSDLLHLEVEVCDECDSLSTDEDDTLTPTQLSSMKNGRCRSQDTNRSKSVRQEDPNQGISRSHDDFDRAERVLKELRSGALFEKIITALDTNMMDVESSKSNSKSRHRRWNANSADHKSMQNSKSNRKQAPFHNNKTTGIASELTNFNTNSSNNVFVQSILAYLGTVEITVAHGNDIPHASLSAIQACVQQLRREQHIHQRVLLKVWYIDI